MEKSAHPITNTAKRGRSEMWLCPEIYPEIYHEIYPEIYPEIYVEARWKITTCPCAVILAKVVASGEMLSSRQSNQVGRNVRTQNTMKLKQQ